MSTLESLRKAFKDFKKNEEELVFTDPEMRILILAIAHHLLNQVIEEKTVHPPEDYISLQEFTDKYLFVAPATMLRYCHQREDFHSQCAIKHANRWYIHEEKALEYLKMIPRFKTRIDRGFFKEIMSQ